MDTDGSHAITDSSSAAIEQGLAQRPGLGQNVTSKMSLVERLQQLEEVFLYGKEGNKYQYLPCLALTNIIFSLTNPNYSPSSNPKLPFI